MGPILVGLGWAAVPGGAGDFPTVDQFRLEGRDWEADIWGPTPMSWEDAPPEASDLLAGIGWHIEVSLEGSEKGLSKVERAVRAIATAGRGVIADEDDVWRPARRSRSRWSVPPPPVPSESELLTMIWWTLNTSTSTHDGARAFVETLQRVLPEAIPVRWGDFERLPLSLEKDGLHGLADYIQRQSHEVLLTKVKAPFAEFSLHGASVLAAQTKARSLRIEVGTSILGQAGWGRQMAIAFTTIAELLQPFYAEARIEPNKYIKEWEPGDMTPGYVPPINDWRWCGFPHAAPMAMLVGPPYTALWPHPGRALGDLIVYSSESWPQPSPGGVPLAPEPLRQEFDPGEVRTATSLGQAPVRATARLAICVAEQRRTSHLEHHRLTRVRRLKSAERRLLYLAVLTVAMQNWRPECSAGVPPNVTGSLCP